MKVLYFVECEWNIGLNNPWEGSRGCYFTEEDAIAAVTEGYNEHILPDCEAGETVQSAIEEGFITIEASGAKEYG